MKLLQHTAVLLLGLILSSAGGAHDHDDKTQRMTPIGKKGRLSMSMGGKKQGADFMSMAGKKGMSVTPSPTTSMAPSTRPSTSNSPSSVPSISQAPSLVPSTSSNPSSSAVPSTEPSISLVPSAAPSISMAPTTMECNCDEPGARKIPFPSSTTDFDMRLAISQYVEDTSVPKNSIYGNNITCWDTSQVTSFRAVFLKQASFNEPLGCWDTSQVIDMRNMFVGAINFDQPIGDWDTSKVTTMEFMFGDAIAFDQDLCAWGNKVDPALLTITSDMNEGTDCDDTTDPNPNDPTNSNWCAVC